MTSAQGKTEALNLVGKIIEAVQDGDVPTFERRMDEFDRLLDRLIAAAKKEQCTDDLKVVMREGAGSA